LSTILQFGFGLPAAGVKPEQAARQLGIFFLIIMVAAFVALI